MYPSDNKLPIRWRILGIVFTLAVIGLCAANITTAIHVYRTTGALRLTNSDANALLSISQNNTQAILLGKGTAAVRLKPGTYQVSANDDGYQTFGVVTIRAKATTNSTLKFSGTPSAAASQLFTLLPFLGPASEYQISYSEQVSGNTSGPLITISANDQQGYADGLQWIRDQGYSPNNYAIQFQQQTFVNYHLGNN